MSTAATLIPRLNSRTARAYRQVRARMQGFVQIRPDYYLKWGLTSRDVVCDCGLGNDADFSVDVMSRFHCKVYGFDPTRKHQPSLQAVEASHKGLFKLHPFAISDQADELEFFESEQNISGSLDRSHKNVRDGVSAYRVSALGVGDIFDVCNEPYFEVLKLDIEGAEYGVASSFTQELADRVGQLLVEFHHDVIPAYSMRDTEDAIEHLESFGFLAMTVDDRNFLFAREKRSEPKA